LEAFLSGNFRRFTIAEVDADLVRAVREADGFYEVNVAHSDRISTERIGPVELLNPTVEEDARRLVEAVAEADELATALPSVAFYGRGGNSSVAGVLAEGVRAALRFWLAESWPGESRQSRDAIAILDMLDDNHAVKRKGNGAA